MYNSYSIRKYKEKENKNHTVTGNTTQYRLKYDHLYYDHKLTKKEFGQSVVRFNKWFTISNKWYESTNGKTKGNKRTYIHTDIVCNQ